MNRDLASILSLRRVLEAVGKGAGVSRSIVESLSGSDGRGAEAARLSLLGNPIAVAMRPLVSSPSEEVAMLASLVVAAPRSSSPLVGASGSAMAVTLERWVKAKEGRALEQKVMRFRSLVTSGVLGGVAAMVSTLGPLVGSLSFTSATTAGGGALTYGAFAMTAISAALLGAYMSGRGFYLNVAVSLVSFGFVSAAASPLVGLSSGSVLGVI